MEHLFAGVALSAWSVDAAEPSRIGLPPSTRTAQMGWCGSVEELLLLQHADRGTEHRTWLRP